MIGRLSADSSDVASNLDTATVEILDARLKDLSDGEFATRVLTPAEIRALATELLLVVAKGEHPE